LRNCLEALLPLTGLSSERPDGKAASRRDFTSVSRAGRLLVGSV